MRVPRRSARTRREQEKKKNQEKRKHENSDYESEQEGNLVLPIQPVSSDSRYPISSSQIAGPSHAGPVIIQGPPVQQEHPYNSDSDTIIYSPIIPTAHHFSSLHMCPAIEKYPTDWISIGHKFDKIMSEVKWNKCSTCSQKFPDLFLRNIIETQELSCSLCVNKSTVGMFTTQNKMDPGPVPPELHDLTPVEEMLIARIHPVISFYKIRGQQMAYSGHVIHFKQDIVNLYNKLPIDPNSTQVFAIITRNTPSGIANLRVRSNRVRQALFWLKQNHYYYRDIEIDEDLIASLPIDGMINLPVIDSVSEETEQIEHDNIIHETNFPQIPQLDQSTAISAALNANIDWPVLQNVPINEFTTEGYLSQAFPTLFPRGNADLLQDRLKKVDFINYFQYLMRYEDGRFARHPRFRFVAFDSIMRWQALKRGSVFVQKNALRDVTAEQLKVMLENNPNLTSKVMFYVGKLRASQSFWSQRCGELLDMVQQIGIPTIFFTLSAADYHWPDLFRLLSPESDPNQLSERERIELMHNNPLITSWFFRRRAETFIDKVLKKIYPVKDFWYRYEWQWRGSPHIHGVLWIEGAPDVSNLDNLSLDERDTIAQWFAKYCSAWNYDSTIPASSIHPSRHKFSEKLDDESDLNSLLNCLQRHTRCGRHCLREDRRTKLIKCRYNFPKALRQDDALVKEDGNWQFLPKRNDDKMARYNAYVTQVWRGNTDFSPITSKDAVLNYIARYATKCEQASVVHKKTLLDLVSNSHNTTSAKTLISKLLINSTAERDFSAQEICHLMMSWPLFHSSRPVVNLVIRNDSWVNLIHSDNENLALLERYKNRPTQMNSLSLYNYAAAYRYAAGAHVLRNKRAIVRIFPRLKLGSTTVENEKYYRLMATAFLPWRNSPETLIEQCQSETPWYTISLNIPHDAPEDIRLEFPLPDDLFEEENPVDPFREQRDQTQAISRAVPVEHEIRALGSREVDEEFPWEENSVSDHEKKQIESWLEGAKSNYQITRRSVSRVTSLSEDQLRIISLCRRQINAIKNNALVRVKRTMIQGKAGSGKSFLIEQLANEFKLSFGEESVAILAPTGVAAVNINGHTIHSFLNIGISKLKPLQGEALRKFQLKMSKLRVVIFDEMSMIGLSLLEKISNRLQEARGSSDEPFGGYIVYFFGDMQQLAPVQDYAWYSETSSALSSRGKLIAETIDRYYLLTTCHRQAGNDQKEFRDILDGLAIGRISDSMYNTLMSRRVSALSQDEVANFSNAIHIYPTKLLVRNHNQEYLRKTGNPVAKIPAQHNIPQGANATEEQAQGLADELFLSVGCKVMLRVNLWTECGLVNGSVGIVRAIRYKEGERPPSLPVAVMIEFEKYTGPYYNDHYIPIIPLKRQWKIGDKTVTRRQFPLLLAHAITAHKSQGLTLDKAAVDIGETEKSLGLSYVALSRVKTISGLMILNTFEKSRIESIAKSKMMISRTNFLSKFS